ncbi:DUF3348 domain-containing protein [Azoarcus sp. KH32C]|uniref:DUF3348 domain-containing protein n=1 Tax=Azoarcus sp. KH32C TaxID=748247 RepID=UPI0002385D14|nr:DUF3348 domain-containing protein [Azoarcus sp. KH32C]BAL26968.1 hypothetical protein AZKH_p0085 [Azoarcus sp. KH32C]
MAQGLPRSHFNSSRLVRALTDLSVADVPESKQSFAERLGQWLDFTDALSLYSALNAGAGDLEPSSAVAPAGRALVRNQLTRVRAALLDSILMDGVSRPGKARIELPIPTPNDSVESAADFAPYHRYYLAHQRDMSANIGSLRATVRNAMARQSAKLKRLAALDAVLDKALEVRERSLLATVPTLLGKRFEHLYQSHQATRAEAQTADDPMQWMQPGRWLATFCTDMQAVLQAELDLRLQPVAGLIAAFDTEVTSKQ